jgi:hypothetical protein
MTTKVILYDYILSCRDYTQDEYWREIIYNCACNKFPKGVKYTAIKRTLYVRSNNAGRIRIETLSLPVDTSNCYETLMYVFTNLLGLKSEKDIEKSKKDIETARQQNNIDLNCEWKKLKPRSVKNNILMNFALSQVEDYGLDKKDVSKLYRLIQLGLQFKKLSSDDFEYENGVVLSIKGLEYNEDTNFFVLTNKPGAISHSASNKPNVNHLEKAVDKWAKTAG